MNLPARTAGLALIALTAGCGGSTSAPSPITGTSLHGEVSDPIGDAVSDPRVAISPDLVHATIDVSRGSMTLVVSLAPGTLDRQTTRVSVLLDTDRSGSTGIRQRNGIGADYGLDLVASVSQATITKADEAGCAAQRSCFNPVGSAAITFVTDGMLVVVPLSALGSSDGRVNFQLVSYVMVTPTASVTLDFMPDETAPFGRVQ